MTIPALMCPVCNVMTNDIEHCPYDGAQMVSFEPVSPSAEDEWLGRSILPSTPDDDGRYYIIKRLGSGGFGHVYLAWHNELRRTVAIKISNRGRNTQGWRVGQQSMQNDGINAVLVEHPNVIRVYDSGSLGRKNPTISPPLTDVTSDTYGHAWRRA